jgi:hypothetical protein
MRDRSAAQIAVAKVQRPFRLDALKAGSDQVGRLLRCHHPHIDFGTEDRRIELHVRASLVGHRAQLAIDDLSHCWHLWSNGVELVAAGHDDLVRGSFVNIVPMLWRRFSL